MGLAIGTCICCGGGGRTKQAQIAAQDAEAPARAAVAVDAVADQLARREATELGRAEKRVAELQAMEKEEEKLAIAAQEKVQRLKEEAQGASARERQVESARHEPLKEQAKRRGLEKQLVEEKRIKEHTGAFFLKRRAERR